jgi:uncharacterized protein
LISKLYKSHVLITGGTGLVGRQLSGELVARGYIVSHLSRERTPSGQFETFLWNPSEEFIEDKALENVDYIIHLAGAGVADKRWTNERKEELYASRIDSTDLIFQKLKKGTKRLSAFISASATGIYGFDTGNTLVTEEQKIQADDFLSDLAQDWENAADQFHELGARVVKFRIGLVLSNQGGLLKRLRPIVNYGLAAPFGNGRQFMSWIHIDDLVNMFVEALENHMLNGTYNAVAPQPVTNSAFIKTLAKVLGKPFFLPGIPRFLLRLGLGEMVKSIAGGNKVSCKKIQDSGFRFLYPELELALRNLLLK